MLPFDITLSKKIFSSLSQNKRTWILKLFENEFQYRKADNLQINEDQLKFKNSFYKTGSNLNIMLPVDQGIIWLEETTNNENRVYYNFSLTRIYVLSFVIGIFAYAASNEWTTTILVALGFLSLNWIVTVLRHKIMFNSLMKKIKFEIEK